MIEDFLKRFPLTLVQCETKMKEYVANVEIAKEFGYEATISRYSVKANLWGELYNFLKDEEDEIYELYEIEEYEKARIEFFNRTTEEWEIFRGSLAKKNSTGTNNENAEAYYF